MLWETDASTRIPSSLIDSDTAPASAPAAVTVAAAGGELSQAALRSGVSRINYPTLVAASTSCLSCPTRGRRSSRALSQPPILFSLVSTIYANQDTFLFHYITYVIHFIFNKIDTVGSYLLNLSSNAVK